MGYTGVFSHRCHRPDVILITCDLNRDFAGDFQPFSVDTVIIGE